MKLRTADKVRWGMVIQVIIPGSAWLIWKTDPLLALLVVSGFVALVGVMMMVIFWLGENKKVKPGNACSLIERKSKGANPSQKLR